MSHPDNQRRLIKRYKENIASEKELQALFGMINTNEINAAIEEDMNEEIAALDADPLVHPYKKKISWYKYLVAAMILMAITAGVFYLYPSKPNTQAKVSKAINDILPGKNMAYLTLSNGKKVILNNLSNGVILQEGDVNITKAASGQIVYTGTDKTDLPNTDNAFNLIETPTGGQYQVVLPDGTRLWLNAASSLKYPTSFKGAKNRKVELTGEAYFEVAKNKAQPFIVKTNSQEVQVLGTHFNINSYADEPEVKTTLLEGSVRVTAMDINGQRKAERILKPGQQCVLTDAAINIKNVDTDEAVAWKNGQFMFTSEPLTAIMRKVSRWYNVEVDYKGTTANKKFTGTVSRYSNVSEVLQTLELTNGVHFKLNGRKITVTEN